VPAWGSLLRDVAAQIGGALLNASGRHVPTPAPRIQQTPIVTPPAPGFAPLSQTPRNQTNAREYAQAYDALFGRVSSRLGPTNPRWTTFSGELKPEVITSAIEQANAGLPFQFCDMLRRAVENDAHLAGCVLQAFAAIVAKPDSIDPPASLVRDPVAQSVAHWLRAVREQVADFDAARFALLWAEATRFAGAENIFGWRKVTWYRADGKRISRQYLVPVKLEIVEARAFRFDVETDEPLLWLQGDYIPLPAGKFIFHVAHGISQIRERGGFGRAVLFLHAIKQWAIRDAALYLHLYGLNQGIISYEAERTARDRGQRAGRDPPSSRGSVQTRLRRPISTERAGAYAVWRLAKRRDHKGRHRWRPAADVHYGRQSGPRRRACRWRLLDAASARAEPVRFHSPGYVVADAAA